MTTSIQWTDETWNPVRGCARVSPGCENCYAERTAHRFSGKGQPYEGLTVLGKHGPRWAGSARFVPEMLDAPLRWRKPKRIFVNSMSDLFHADITNEQIAAVFGAMAACPQHTFQILTKRPDRMVEWFASIGDDPLMELAGIADKLMTSNEVRHLYKHFDDEMGETDLPWPLPNVWLGVSCEDQQRADERVPLLLQTPAAVRFVSAEPLLGPIVFDANMLGCVGHLAATFGNSLISWVIVGGESGPGARPCNADNIRSIAAQCKDAGVACFVKQLGTHVIQDGGRRIKADRKGGDMDEWPHDLRVREFPAQ